MPTFAKLMRAAGCKPVRSRYTSGLYSPDPGSFKRWAAQVDGIIDKQKVYIVSVGVTCFDFESTLLVTDGYRNDILIYRVAPFTGSMSGKGIVPRNGTVAELAQWVVDIKAMMEQLPSDKRSLAGLLKTNFANAFGSYAMYYDRKVEDFLAWFEKNQDRLN